MATNEESQSRAAEIVRMRRSGALFGEIAARFNLGETRVRTIYYNTLKAIPAPDVAALREEQLGRLDELRAVALAALASNQPVVQNGRVVRDDRGRSIPDQAVKLAAVKSLVEIENRRAKLMGLDAPAKHAIEVPEVIRYEIGTPDGASFDLAALLGPPRPTELN